MRLSPSQIKRRLDCAHQWALVSLANLATPTSKAAELGTQVHERLEAFVRDGAELNPADPVDRIAIRGIQGLSDLDLDNARVEGAFEFEILSGVLLIGRIDLVARDGEGRTIVIDHKTSSNPARWGITDPKALARDPQAIIYGARYPGARVRFIYYPTRGAKTHVVECTPEPIDSLMPTIREMVRWHRLYHSDLAKPEDVPRNRLSCGKYGGCHFLPRCGGQPAAAVFADAAKLIAPTSAPIKERKVMTEIDIDALLEGVVNSAAPAAPAPKGSDPAMVNPPAAPAAPAATAAPAAPKPAPATAAPAPKPAPEPINVPTPKAVGGIFLYIDCLPIDGGHASEYVMADELCEAAHKKVREAYRSPHYAMVDHGNGYGAINAALAEELEGVSVVVALTSSRIVAHCLETLRKAAAATVMGAR